jgi:ABC-type amino acid transport substrate-binding protein
MKKLMITTIIVVTTMLVLTWVRHNKQVKANRIPQELIVGTTADYAPMVFIKDNEIVGFDVDIMREVAKRLGTKVTFKNLPFEVLFYELQRGNIHVIAASMVITPERAVYAHFSRPYLFSDLVLMTKKNLTKKSVNFTDKKIVVNCGYYADFYISQKTELDPSNIIRVSSIKDALMLLMNDKADLFITAQYSVEPIFEIYGKEQFNTVPIADSKMPIALATCKEQIKLSQDIDKIVHDMIVDSTIDTFKLTWQITHA